LNEGHEDFLLSLSALRGFVGIQYKDQTDLSEEEFYEISQYYKEFNHEDEDESFEEFIK
jgi:hypothetical protein